jgi:hypothetical protein
MRMVRPRLRLGSFLLLVVIAAQGVAFVIYRERAARREEGLRAALALYRDGATEAILDRLEQPFNVPYTEGDALEDLLKAIKARTRGPKLATGIPIYVDPVGLQEAEQTLSAKVQTPAAPASEGLTLGEQLTRVLRPLGLVVRH